MSQKIKVAVLGATGMVGQVFVQQLADHPWFELSALVSSSRAGTRYADAVRWLPPTPLPEYAAGLTLQNLDPDRLHAQGIRLLFSALPADVARTVERRLRHRGFGIFSNASAFRYHRAVPILIPEINSHELAKIEDQGYPDNGFIVTNANCTTTGLVLALAPLRRFGIRSVYVSTYQSLSGAGYPGLSALDMSGNVRPHIAGEATKLQRETVRILGTAFPVYAHCVRVPVTFGHLETVWLNLQEAVTTGDIRQAWQDFHTVENGLPSLPSTPLQYDDAADAPQPAHSFWGDPPGMSVRLGGLDVRHRRVGFRLLVNNLVRGAAGGSVANAELFLRRYGGRT